MNNMDLPIYRLVHRGTALSCDKRRVFMIHFNWNVSSIQTFRYIVTHSTTRPPLVTSPLGSTLSWHCSINQTLARDYQVKPLPAADVPCDFLTVTSYPSSTLAVLPSSFTTLHIVLVRRFEPHREVRRAAVANCQLPTTGRRS